MSSSFGTAGRQHERSAVEDGTVRIASGSVDQKPTVADAMTHWFAAQRIRSFAHVSVTTGMKAWGAFVQCAGKGNVYLRTAQLNSESRKASVTAGADLSIRTETTATPTILVVKIRTERHGPSNPSGSRKENGKQTRQALRKKRKNLRQRKGQKKRHLPCLS